MSLPASDSNEPKPALSTPAPQPPQEFDLLAFWILHQRLIIRLIIAAVLAVIVWGVWLFMEYRKKAGSEEALAAAKTAVEYRKVTGDWSGTPAAGTAYIRLAEELRKEGKSADAAQALKEFMEKYPVHPLRVPASHALASSLETAGKLDEALGAYQQFAASHGSSAFAPLAYLGQARVLIALGRGEEAAKALESVEQKYPGNPFAEDARILLDEIKNAAGRKTGGSPRPTPPPTPAPPAIPLGITPAPTPPAPGLPAGVTTPLPMPTTPPTPVPPTQKPETATPPAPAPPVPTSGTPAPATPKPALPEPATPSSTPPATKPVPPVPAPPK